MKRAVVRLPPDLLDRLDRLAAKLRGSCPDHRVSRAAVARALIASGLEVAEAGETPHPSRSMRRCGASLPSGQG